MARRIALGSKFVVVPIYVLSGALMFIDQQTPGGALGRLGIFVLLGGGFCHVLGRHNRNKAELRKQIDLAQAELLEKIDRSVGKVWDAGERAGDRRRELEAASQPLAAVRDLVPRR